MLLPGSASPSVIGRRVGLSRPLTLLRDDELLVRWPDPEALDLVYRRNVDAILRFASRRCQSSQDVADLVSLTFIAVVESGGTFDPRRGTARAWLFGIAHRCWADQLRDHHRRAELLRRLPSHLALAPDEARAVEDMIDAERQRPALMGGVAELSASERDVLLLVAFEDLSVAEAAHALGIAPVAARMRLMRARRKLSHDLRGARR